MATNAQILANQANANHSTGPKTPQGKAVVSRNAVKHGIFYHSLDADTPQYQELLVGLFEALKPRDELQRMLVEQIAVTIVRLKRLVRHEDRHIAGVDFDAERGAPFSAVGAYIADGTAERTTRYESALNRLLHRLLRTYGEMRDDEGWRRLWHDPEPSPYLVTVEVPGPPAAAVPGRLPSSLLQSDVNVVAAPESSGQENGSAPISAARRPEHEPRTLPQDA